MIPVYVGIGLAVLFALVLLYSLLRAAELGDHMLDQELSELEVQQHVHPDGNVHVLTPTKETDQSD